MGLRARVGRRAPMQALATAGVLGVAVVVAVLLQRHHLSTTPASEVIAPPAASSTASSTATPLPPVPAPDLAAASLTGASALVTPFQMMAGDGTAETLIGAYADPSRIVLFLRGPSVGTSPSPGPPAIMEMSVYDSHGFLNGGTTGGRGIAGDSFFALDLGPHVDRDGFAHLTVTDNPPQQSFTAPPPSTGWAFRFTLKIHAATSLSAPTSFQLGSWKVTIENLAATPSVIDFEALVAGANNEQLFNVQSQPVTLLDAAGNEVNPITAGGGITVPKQQLNPTNYQNTRVHYQWARPSSAGTYRLRVSGNGATQTVTLQIPGP